MPLTDRKVPVRMRIAHHRVSLDDVVKYYAKGLGADIWKYNYFCDIAKGQVIYELYIEEIEGGIVPEPQPQEDDNAAS